VHRFILEDDNNTPVDMAFDEVGDLDSVQEALLLLIGATGSGILSTELRIQKLGFLLAKSLQDEELDKDFDFVPYDYGPFSENLDSAIDLLGSQGYLTKDDDRNVYRVTAEGKKIAELLARKNTHRAQIAKDLVEYLGKLHTDDLVGVVYELYPEYARSSVILDRLKRRRSYDSVTVPTTSAKGEQSHIVKSRLGRKLVVKAEGDTVHIVEIIDERPK